jgi:hypothetical protein
MSDQLVSRAGTGTLGSGVLNTFFTQVPSGSEADIWYDGEWHRLSRVILEAKAAMPCYDEGLQDTSREHMIPPGRPAGSGYACCPKDQLFPPTEPLCPTCTARAELAKVTAGAQ